MGSGCGRYWLDDEVVYVVGGFDGRRLVEFIGWRV